MKKCRNCDPVLKKQLCDALDAYLAGRPRVSTKEAWENCKAVVRCSYSYLAQQFRARMDKGLSDGSIETGFKNGEYFIIKNQ